MDEIKGAEALQRLRLLLGIYDGSRDGILTFLLEDAENLILGHCRRQTLPQGLLTLLPALAADLYRAKGYGAETAPERVTEVTQGDRSVRLADGTVSDAEILSGYYKRLAPYVNKRGLVPSDVTELCQRV